jgi:Zn-dependent M28 family amino/carboxypeptidase
MKSMKNFLPVISLLLIVVFSIFTTTCTKDEDTGTLSKEEIILDLNDKISADTLESLVAWMQGMGTRFALADNHRNVAIKIKNRFKMIGYSNARLDSFMISKTYIGIPYDQWQYNVIATLEGNVSPDSICIIGAHYDNALITGDPFSIVPGANDNASGVAAALEIARVMKKNNYSPGNTIEFIAFGSEELGLYGSFAYASVSKQLSKKIKLMLNNDMIAYQPGTNQAEWTVNIIDYDNSHNLRTEAEQMCSNLTVLNYINDNTYNKQSDSYPFFLYDYKALFFFSNNIDPGYHSLNDLTSNCNFEYCREIVKISCALLVDNS